MFSRFHFNLRGRGKATPNVHRGNPSQGTFFPFFAILVSFARLPAITVVQSLAFRSTAPIGGIEPCVEGTGAVIVVEKIFEICPV
ncbi:hypothetical protein CEXT_307151 [Caerostris extrusa]|uniref:Uncharacterized protein n=1 Tax=Caerostris extrusa TaxID=172846 RepID=A0AAV4UVM0_CAEEX|nr:hypothetical protein CEXT_307151 [Caerostris extrusa]